MQSGSGTWDIEPSVTARGQAGAMGWGVQASYRWRTESANASGFAFGDRAAASAWASWLASPDLSLTGRLSYEHEGRILGHYNGAHRHATPSDRQANYGGDKVFASAGLNYALPFGGAKPVQLGVEAGLPLYQDLNGIQLPESWRIAVSLSKAF